MKEFISAFIYILFSGFSFAQNYFSFLDTNSVWHDENELYTSHGSSYLDQIWWDSKEYLKNDTLIFGIEYKKLYLSGYKRHYNYPPGRQDSILYCNYYLGGLREFNKKVYFIDSTGSERLLFNFDLNIGDTLSEIFPSPNGNFQYYVYSIDSIYIYNSYRKRINLAQTGYTTPDNYFIEGIGSKRGLLGYLGYMAQMAYPKEKLKKYSYNNTEALVLYSSSSLDNICEINNSIPIDNINSELFVFPNPVYDLLFLSGLYQNQYLIELYDFQGKCLMKNMYDKDKQISFFNFPAGVYCLRVIDTHQIIMNFRIIKLY